jgi:hypothetical protein
MPLMVNEATIEEITEALGYVTETMRAADGDQRASLLRTVDGLLDALAVNK